MTIMRSRVAVAPNALVPSQPGPITAIPNDDAALIWQIPLRHGAKYHVGEIIPKRPSLPFVSEGLCGVNELQGALGAVEFPPVELRSGPIRPDLA
jgi:hypothetical protein